jgi:hypothetical protein
MKAFSMRTALIAAAGGEKRRHLIRSLCWIALVFVAFPTLADGDRERALRAVEQGHALHLSEILAKVRPDLGGEIVGVSFKEQQERWIYEFKVIEPTGRLVEVYVDATTARILKRETD